MDFQTFDSWIKRIAFKSFLFFRRRRPWEINVLQILYTTLHYWNSHWATAKVCLHKNGKCPKICMFRCCCSENMSSCKRKISYNNVNLENIANDKYNENVGKIEKVSFAWSSSYEWNISTICCWRIINHLTPRIHSLKRFNSQLNSVFYLFRYWNI